MESTIKQKSIRARLAPAIIAAIIAAVGAIVVACIGYAATTYQARHDDSKILSGYTHQLSFAKSSGTKSSTFSLTPVKGNLYFSAMQTSGKVNSDRPYYRIKSKKASESSYATEGSLGFTKNNIFSKEYYMRSVSKGTKYNVLVERYAGHKYASKLTVDWLVK